MKTRLTAAVLFTSGALCFPAAAATTITGFGDGSAFTLTGRGGAPTISTGQLNLSSANDQARSAFATAKQDITSFTTSFRYQNVPTVSTAADGFAFVIQNQAVNALGGKGGDIGYTTTGGNGGTAIGTSVGVIFNIFNNDSTSVASNGSSTLSNLLAKVNTTPATLFNLADIVISYNGTNLSFTATNANNPAESITRNVDVNIATIVGGNTAWVGFTGGTGGASSVQTLTNFTFATPVPEPSAALLGAVGALALMRRRR